MLIKNIIMIFACSILSACGISPAKPYVAMEAKFPNAPVVVPFYDNYWLLLQDLKFTAKRTSDGKPFEITVPAGFVTDLASIPVPLNLIYDKTGRYSSAGILHDYLYWTQFCDRKRSDRLIKEGLKATGAEYMTRNTIKYGVYWFGWVAWDNNAKAIRAGEERYVPEAMRTFSSDTHWGNYKKNISKDVEIPWQKKGVREEVVAGCQIFDKDE